MLIMNNKNACPKSDVMTAPTAPGFSGETQWVWERVGDGKKEPSQRGAQFRSDGDTGCKLLQEYTCYCSNIARWQQKVKKFLFSLLERREK